MNIYQVVKIESGRIVELETTSYAEAKEYYNENILDNIPRELGVLDINGDFCSLQNTHTTEGWVPLIQKTSPVNPVVQTPLGWKIC